MFSISIEKVLEGTTRPVSRKSYSWTFIALCVTFSYSCCPVMEPWLSGWNALKPNIARVRSCEWQPWRLSSTVQSKAKSIIQYTTLQDIIHIRLANYFVVFFFHTNYQNHVQKRGERKRNSKIMKKSCKTDWIGRSRVIWSIQCVLETLHQVSRKKRELECKKAPKG